MAGGRKGLAGDLGEKSGCDPDADSGHAHQDRVKRVGLHEFFDHCGDLVTLPMQARELFGQPWQHGRCRAGANHDDSLLAQGSDDVAGELFAHAWCEFGQTVRQPFLTGSSQSLRRGIALQQVQHCPMTDPRAQHPFQSGMDLGQQTTDPVTGRVDLQSQIIIKSTQHRQFSDLFIAQVNRPQCVRHGPCGLSNNESITGIGLSFARMEIRDATHREPRQISDRHASVLGHRDRERPDRGRLIDYHQHRAVGLQIIEDCP